MTQKTLETAGSDIAKLAQPPSLVEAIQHHCNLEKASFHTPGHKGRWYEERLACEEFGLAKYDVTELPGLDDFTSPQGPIQHLSERVAQLWGASGSFLSVNGASAAIVAAIMACAVSGKRVLLPRSCHRSAVHALVLSGMDPVWYDACWDDEWQVWSGIEAGSFARLLDEHGDRLACALVNSVDYSGSLTNISDLAARCRKANIPIIVDEAHGAHCLTGSALSQGADFVVHSLHKTLGALTQTGVLHVGSNCKIQSDKVKAALNLIHSSSPSYLLLSSVEQAIHNFKSLAQQIARTEFMANELRHWLSRQGACVFQGRHGVDSFHLLFKFPEISGQELASALIAKGVYPETVLGQGVLLLLGLGNNDGDVTGLQEAIDQIKAGSLMNPSRPQAHFTPRFGDQLLNPRQAWSTSSETIEITKASGRIASDCVAPCPPGTPVLCPGQRILDDITTLLPEHRWLRVVAES